jgi:DNA repair exonuclease SbcCD ATPase subunit
LVSASYRAEVGVALEVLAEGLAPFVDRAMREHLPGEDWIVTAATRLGKREPVLASPTDPQFQLEVMVRWWGPVVAPRLSRDTRETVQALRRARNDWAHIDESHPIDLEYARRIHSLAEDLLQEIGSPMADELSRLGEQLHRDAARRAAQEQGISEADALIHELTDLQGEREALTRQLEDAQNAARAAVGHQRAVARQLAELQAQYAAVSGLRERYREVQAQLDETRQAGEREAQDMSVVRHQLENTEQAVEQLQRESSRLHQELETTRGQLETIDPAETEIGRRWLWLYAALVLVLGIAVILAVAKGTTL